MAITSPIYADGATMDGPTHPAFVAAITAGTEAEQLAFADRLAEKARLLRKAILNKTVVSTADQKFTTGTPPGAFTAGEYTDPLDAHIGEVVLAAALDCFKAANNE